MQLLLRISLLLCLAAVPAAAQKFKDDGITNEVHRAHVGQIVFSEKEIELDAKASDFKKAFSVGEGIFGRVFAATSSGNVVGEPVVERHYFMKIDGKPVSGPDYMKGAIALETAGPPGATTWTTWRLVVIPGREALTDPLKRRQAEAFGKAFGELSPGEHQVELELRIKNRQGGALSNVVAKGGFSLKVGGDAKASLEKQLVRELPKVDNYGGDDAAAIKAQVLAACERKFGSRPVRVGLVSHAWEEGRYVDTLVWWRKIHAWVAWGGDAKDPNMGSVTAYVFRAEKGSSGQWSPLVWLDHSSSVTPYRIPVKDIK